MMIGDSALQMLSFPVGVNSGELSRVKQHGIVDLKNSKLVFLATSGASRDLIEIGSRGSVIQTVHQ